MTNQNPSSRRTFIKFLAAGLTPNRPSAEELSTAVIPTDPSERLVGVAYTLSHMKVPWEKSWGTPSIGYYQSDNREVINIHMKWLVNANVDFLLLDVSNDLDSDIRSGAGAPFAIFEENVMVAILEVLSSTVSPLKIVPMIGYDKAPSAIYDGRLSIKSDEIFSYFVSNSNFNKYFLRYLGKPLLVVYGQTPAVFQDRLPPWNDSRFTVRFMTCFVTEQPRLLHVANRHISRLGYWSWEDRGYPTFPLMGGTPEIMTVTAAWRDSKPERLPARGRADGKTFRDSWAWARKIGPRFVLSGTFNEWYIGEQPSSEVSKDLEPSEEFGWKYLDILREEASLFKRGA